jgi:uncharacterized protein YbaP (TraB family)
VRARSPLAAGLVALALLAGTCPTAQARDRALLWTLEGKNNTVYLLGSIHVLRPADNSLTPAAESAYRNAERLLMEIDLDAPGLGDATGLVRAMQSAAMLPAGQTLRSVLGADYEDMAADARRHGVDLALFDPFAPWFVATLLIQQSLMALGFDPGLGIEQQLASRAIEDDKPIDGLETPAEQFAIFARLTPAQQREFLRSTLDELEDAEEDADELLDAWRRGDEAELARLLIEAQAQSPELYGPLTVDRNRAWVDDLEALLDDPDDYLVVVGALHLVGPQSVVDLLRARGHRVERR